MFLLPILVFAQKPLRGLIVSNNNSDLQGVTVTNEANSSVSVTNSKGNFTIEASIDDMILFSSVNFKDKKIKIKKSNFSDNLLVVQLEPLIEQLDEVFVSKSKIDAVSAGILQKPAKHYTPAERKLRAAGQLHWYSPLLIPVGGMSVDGLLNSISGRTKMLKKELIVERKEMALQSIDNMYQDNYFIKTLKIPVDYVKAFKYYIVDNVELRSVLKQKNKTKADFILSQLAPKYLEILKD